MLFVSGFIIYNYRRVNLFDSDFFWLLESSYIVFHLWFLVHLFQPSVRLHLRVNDQRPSARFPNNDARLNANIVSGKASKPPIPDLYLVTQRVYQRVVSCNFNSFRLTSFHPNCRQIVTIGCQERAQVRERSCCNENVARVICRVHFHVLNRFLPPNSFFTEQVQ